MYKVSLKGRSGILYQEGERKALIDAEMLTGETDLVIYFSRFKKWQEPNSNIEVTDSDKVRIKTNISNYLGQKGLQIEWE